MSQSRLPSKLGKEPLVDVVCEVRFQSSMSPSEVLPGLLFASLASESDVKVTRTPIAELPTQVRKIDQQLRYQPLVRIEWSRYLILVGDESIAIACKIPYPGWAEFKKTIERVVGLVIKSNIIGNIERYSLKFVDLIPSPDLGQQIKTFNWNLRVGSHELQSEIVNVRIEINKGSTIHAINIVTGAQVGLATGEVRVGAIIDVDSIVNLPSMRADDFLAAFPDLIANLHQENKATFFECLSSEGLAMLEPHYDD